MENMMEQLLVSVKSYTWFAIKFVFQFSIAEMI